ncbi:MAG: hypothetical protein ABJE95_16500, partial [Byssovorax sp.]
MKQPVLAGVFRLPEDLERAFAAFQGLHDARPIAGVLAQEHERITARQARRIEGEASPSLRGLMRLGEDRVAQDFLRIGRILKEAHIRGRRALDALRPVRVDRLAQLLLRALAEALARGELA